jgi:hypothetical protein
MRASQRVTHDRCRCCGHVLPACLPAAKRPNGAMLLAQPQPVALRPGRPDLERMHTEDIGGGRPRRMRSWRNRMKCRESYRTPREEDSPSHAGVGPSHIMRILMQEAMVMAGA